MRVKRARVTVRGGPDRKAGEMGSSDSDRNSGSRGRGDEGERRQSPGRTRRKRRD